jgi:SH3-like domain-containing protein
MSVLRDNLLVRYLLAGTLAAVLCWATPAVQAESAAAATLAPATTFRQMVTDIQRMLTELGYRPGSVDGSYGQNTRQAIKRYQANTGLPVDGHPSEALRQHLGVTSGAVAPKAATSGGASAAAGTRKSNRKAAWQGRTVSDALLRIAPSGSSASSLRLAKGTPLEVIRRQGAWLEVRVKSSGAEGWVKNVSVVAVGGTASAPPKKKSEGFFANLARGVSRLMGGSPDPPEEEGSVTVGIRGLAPEDLARAIPDPAELDKMESYRADRDQAFRFAGAEKLTAQTVEYIQAAGGGSSSPAPSGGRDE